MQFGAKNETKKMDKNSLGLAQIDLFLVQSSVHFICFWLSRADWLPVEVLRTFLARRR